MTDTPASPSPSPAPATPAPAPAAPAAASPSTPSSPVTTTPAQASPAANQRPEYIPETHWDSAAGKVKDDKAFASFINEHVAFKAAEDSRKLSLPQNADAYKVELPADFKPPEGVQFKFNDADPLLAQARTLAHEMGIPQEGFSKLLGLYAGAQVASQQQVVAARNAEIAKLGATGPARVDALSTFFTAQLGEAEGKQIMARVFTAADVTIMEKLVAKIATQGGATFRTNGREPPQAPGTKSAEEVARMTPAQRLDYNRQFDQSKMPGWKDPRAA